MYTYKQLYKLYSSCNNPVLKIYYWNLLGDYMVDVIMANSYNFFNISLNQSLIDMLLLIKHQYHMFVENTCGIYVLCVYDKSTYKLQLKVIYDNSTEFRNAIKLFTQGV